MTKQTIKSIYYTISSAFLTAPAVVFAQQGQYQPSAPGRVITLRDVQNAIVRIAEFMIFIGVAIAVIFIIWGGITYMTAGGDDTKLGTAKKRIIYGLVGAAIVIGIGTIIRTLGQLVTQGGGIF